MSEQKTDFSLKDVIAILDTEHDLELVAGFSLMNDLVEDLDYILFMNRFVNSKGIALRPISNNNQIGLWVAEYEVGKDRNSKIINQTIVYDDVTDICKTLERYLSKGISFGELKEKLTIDLLKEKIKVGFVQNFKFTYLFCPRYRKLHCKNINGIYEELKDLAGNNGISYIDAAKIISKYDNCHDVIVCDLKEPNELSRVMNFLNLAGERITFANSKLYINK